MAFFGVCYSPYRQGNDPPPRPVSEAEVGADLALIAARKFTHTRIATAPHGSIATASPGSTSSSTSPTGPPPRMARAHHPHQHLGQGQQRRHHRQLHPGSPAKAASTPSALISPPRPREQLTVLPDSDWQANKDRLTYEAWAQKTMAAQQAMAQH